MKSTEKFVEHTADAAQLSARKNLIALFNAAPMDVEDMLFNLGLFTRSGLLVKFLLLSELYQRFSKVPGIFVEFGTWFGQNLVLLENLRAIHEPFNKQRRIVGFDTFTGYKEGKFADEKLYATGAAYRTYLEALLKCHQEMNVYGHMPGDHELIQGDVKETAPDYFKKHPEATVAFAYFDMGPELPTYAALSAIKPHLVPGSILLLDEFTWHETPGEAIAFKRVFGQSGYRIEKCALYNSKAIVEIL